MAYDFLDHMMLRLDPLFIFFFRLTGVAFPDFLIGVFVLAMACVMIGEATLSLALRFNRDHIDGLRKEILKRDSQSAQAYHTADRMGYKALNKAANDAWGKHFFTMAAYSAGMLWPAPFAMAWMNIRFQGVFFDLCKPLSWIFGETIQYPFVFVIIYILCRILFKYCRPWLPYFKQVQQMLDGMASTRRET
jgi:hypothetical protein